MTNRIDLIADFRRHLTDKELSPRTIDTYEDIVSHMVDYIEENYDARFEDDAVKGYMVSNWYTSIRDFKPTTKSLRLLTVRQFLRFLYNMQYVKFDLSLALPKPQSISTAYRIHPEDIPNKRAYTEEEISAMMNYRSGGKGTDERNRAIIAMMVSSGLRAAELCALNVGDVFSGNDFAMVPRKGTHGNKVKVAIPQDALPYVEEHLQYRKSCGLSIDDDAPLISRMDGGRMTPQNLYCSLMRLEKKVGVPTGTHTFRHTALTATAKMADPVVARDLAGQKSINITNRYLHSTDDDLIEATQKLGSKFLRKNVGNSPRDTNEDGLNYLFSILQLTDDEKREYEEALKAGKIDDFDDFDDDELGDVDLDDWLKD